MSSKQKTKIGVIGGGPAGVFASIFASENPNNEILIFDKNEILKTLLPTGGGRCNLAYGEFDNKELTKFYPRGEKFLLSVFSKFSTADTLAFFEKIGVTTYMQDDFRFFPKSNSASTVRKKLLKQLEKPNIKIIKNHVIDIKKQTTFFTVKTQEKEYIVEKIIFATGGKGDGHKFAKNLGHNIIPLKPSLCALKIKEDAFFKLSGLTLKHIDADIFYKNKKITEQNGDILFTHYGISGPLPYKISSLCADIDFNKANPLTIKLNLVANNIENFWEIFGEELKNNPQKNIINVLNNFIPNSLAEVILQKREIDKQIKCGQLKKTYRTMIVNDLTNLELNAYGKRTGEEIVTAGGIDLKEINQKTMESKLVKNLFFCGEMIDIDGLTGGFNLQNCWSTGFIAGSSLK